MKRKLKKKHIIILAIIIILIISSIFGIKRSIEIKNYHKTYEYKFLQLEYTMEEFKIIDKLSTESKDYLLTVEYNRRIPKLIEEKYFMEKNLEKYIGYFDKESDLTKIVAIINVGRDNAPYTDTKKADLSKNELMLVNKYNYLDNTYDGANMESVGVKYSYGSNQKLDSVAFDQFKKMFNDAKDEGLTLIINSSYRSYEEQENLYERYKKNKGEEYADSIAARPGYSEHQTGYAMDIITYDANIDTFDSTDEFRWLQDNAYKYGFILRYPKDKDYITGYEYESWHFRYVGLKAAKYIHENDITFDEYYAYFIEGDTNEKEEESAN